MFTLSTDHASKAELYATLAEQARSSSNRSRT
jgi:hypothetical protein